MASLQVPDLEIDAYPSTSSAAPDPAPRATDPRSGWRGRDPAIDIIRGLCLVSMLLGHLAGATTGGSVLDEVAHLPLFVDGAAGFVFLSGVSIALADTRRLLRGESRVTRTGWLLGRSVFLYGVHVAMTLVSLLVLSTTTWPHWAGPANFGWSTVGDVLSLHRLVAYLDILPLYAIFVAFAAAALWSRAPRALGTVAGVSLLVYLSSQFWPGWTALRSGDSPQPVWVLGAWQALFFGGLLAGTHWPALRARLDGGWRRGAILVAAAAIGLIVAIRTVYVITAAIGWPSGKAWRHELEYHVFAKASLTIPALLLYIGFGTGIYLAVSAVLARRRHAFGPLEAMGMRSLRLYVVTCLTVVLFWVAVGASPADADEEIAAVVGILILVVAARLRTVGRGRAWSI